MNGTLKVPTILFPVSDLLLLGHTKQMHLFEPRWVNMIDTAREISEGFIALVYVDADGDIVRTVTVAEVVACSNLEAAGRMVNVRGVSRGHLRGLSEEVFRPDNWGVALVEELPELNSVDCSGGLPHPSLAQTASELVALVQNLDLSEPGADDASGAAAPSGRDEDGVSGGEIPAEEEGPKLWTHERSSLQEELSKGIDSDTWNAERAAVAKQLAGVTLSSAAGAQWNDEAHDAVTTLYTVLNRVSPRTKVELFGSPKEYGLEQRLRSLADSLQEKQGMARAKRALAAVFSTSGDVEGSRSGGDGGGGSGA